MRVTCVGYRNWALEIYDALCRQSDHEFLIFRSREEFCEQQIASFQPDMILFYGWSWKIQEDLYSKYPCVMLHPSPLPKYRGGSPLQNQIINGETASKVTLFLVDGQLDAGDIIASEGFSLEGSLDDILGRVVDVGTRLSIDVLDNGFVPEPQQHEYASVFNRRKPEHSEITLDELATMPAVYLYNKIRMLQDPYPNPFFRTSDGKKLIFKSVIVDE